jgi:class 3 adenylate cyclase
VWLPRCATLGSVLRTSTPERVLATVLFTDIVGSTELAARLGDREWRNLVARHHRAVRSQLKRHRGREIDTAGDGFFAIFDRPAHAIWCSIGIIESVSNRVVHYSFDQFLAQPALDQIAVEPAD